MFLMLCIHVDFCWPRWLVGEVGRWGQLKVTLAGLLLHLPRHSLGRRSHQGPYRSY